MNNRKRKPEFGFTYIALGLVLGFFLGSGIVYWYSNRQNDSIFVSNLWNYFARIFQGDDEAGTYQVREELSQAPGRVKPEKTASETNLSDTISMAEMVDDLPADSLNTDTITVIHEEDFFADLPDEEESPEGLNLAEYSAAAINQNIHIAQDSLVGIRAFSLPKRSNEAPRDPSLRQLDSLLGNYERKAKPENMMIVEFWLSPLNFQAYKMSHNKIVIYGLNQMESFSLLSDGNDYYVKYFEDYYPLSLTMDFKPLVPTNDPELMEERQEIWP